MHYWAPVTAGIGTMLERRMVHLPRCAALQAAFRPGHQLRLRQSQIVLPPKTTNLPLSVPPSLNRQHLAKNELSKVVLDFRNKTTGPDPINRSPEQTSQFS